MTSSIRSQSPSKRSALIYTHSQNDTPLIMSVFSIRPTRLSLYRSLYGHIDCVAAIEPPYPLHPSARRSRFSCSKRIKTVQLPLSISSSRYMYPLSLSPTHLVSNSAGANKQTANDHHRRIRMRHRSPPVYPGGEEYRENPRSQSHYRVFLHHLSLITHPSHFLALAPPPAAGMRQGAKPTSQGRWLRAPNKQKVCAQ